MTNEGRHALIFDIGGVIVDWDPRYLFDGLIPDPHARDRFLTDICPRWWNVELDRGRPFESAVRERVRDHPAWACYIRAYQHRWLEMLGGLVAGMEALLLELHAAGAPLYAITNWSAETFPLARRTFPVLEMFDDAVVVSGEVGLVKPDPRIFELALRRFGLAPDRCLFIDDNEENVVAAGLLGMRAQRFTDAASLRGHPDVATYLTNSGAPGVTEP
jgi:2-haloacid dehalogenase